MNQYQVTIDTENKIVTKTDEFNQKSWSWPLREYPRQQQKNKIVASNGVTIEKIANKGLKVRVRHFRYALYSPYKPLKVKNKPPLIKELVVPSSFRKNKNYVLSPKGGYTHITIQLAKKKYLCYSSECAKDETFCYNVGVATALSRMDRETMVELGLV
jgi:hypothetical protein